MRVTALCPGSTESEFHEVAGQQEHRGGPQKSAEKVARVGLQALAGGKPLVISGWKVWLGMEGQRLAPRRWVASLTGRNVSAADQNQSIGEREGQLAVDVAKFEGSSVPRDFSTRSCGKTVRMPATQSTRTPLSRHTLLSMVR